MASNRRRRLEEEEGIVEVPVEGQSLDQKLVLTADFNDGADSPAVVDEALNMAQNHILAAR